MVRSRSRVALVAFLMAAPYPAGCSRNSKPSTLPDGAPRSGSITHDPDDVAITEADVALPANLAEAVERISGYRDQIRSAMEAGTPKKAHRPLDELDIVLKKLMPLVRESGVAKTEWQDINLATKSLQDSFNRLHSAIDQKQTPDYASVEEAINSGIEVLQTATKKAEPSSK
jgi:hypothetical protein